MQIKYIITTLGRLIFWTTTLLVLTGLSTVEYIRQTQSLASTISVVISMMIFSCGYVFQTNIESILGLIFFRCIHTSQVNYHSVFYFAIGKIIYVAVTSAILIAGVIFGIKSFGANNHWITSLILLSIGDLFNFFASPICGFNPMTHNSSITILSVIILVFLELMAVASLVVVFVYGKYVCESLIIMNIYIFALGAWTATGMRINITFMSVLSGQRPISDMDEHINPSERTTLIVV